jgi:hypothetical protein
VAALEVSDSEAMGAMVIEADSRPLLLVSRVIRVGWIPAHYAFKIKNKLCRYTFGIQQGPLLVLVFI